MQQPDENGISAAAVHLQVRDSVNKVRARLRRLKRIVLYEEQQLGGASSDPAADKLDDREIPGLVDLIRTLHELSLMNSPKQAA